MELTSQHIKVADSLEAVNRLFYGRGWTDGLPIVPPTEEAVAKMVEYLGREPQEVVVSVPPRWGEATVEKIAINAVMAGCLPEYLPVIIAAMEAMAEAPFNLYGVQATTHPCAPLVIVNGPAAQELEINWGYGAFGPAWRANATIGRAVRLVLMNVGGAVPGTLDKATQGHPGKFSFCIAENEVESPWEPLHVERGFPREASTVTVTACEGPHNINDHAAISAVGVLKTVAGTMAEPGSNNMAYTAGEPLLCLGPEHAETVARDGFTKVKVKEYLYQNARLPVSVLSPERVRERQQDKETYAQFDAKGFLPVCRRQEDIMVMVVGGAGKHSAFLPSFGLSRSVTKEIRFPAQKAG
ncbi:MAG: hypothetical protein Q8O76_00885 [Chloroflexota bacterium]|nr:hypothetical protein [Chloroflexota bacterium]